MADKAQAGTARRADLDPASLSDSLPSHQIRPCPLSSLGALGKAKAPARIMHVPCTYGEVRVGDSDCGLQP